MKKMTVKQLIKELQKFSKEGDEEVVVSEFDFHVNSVERDAYVGGSTFCRIHAKVREENRRKNH
jgi:hypothetical protein